jgi:glucosyl-dolichyl phosphate glucuronosyltransferase
MVPELSVIISTYNRCEILRGALESLFDQDLDRHRYEVIVVDNNCTDDTRLVVESLREKYSDSLVYCFESEQGVSHARNKGIGVAKADLVAFIDDDIRPLRNWASSVLTAFQKFPLADCIGGRVLPLSETALPPWLTKMNWTAMAFLDLGDAPLCLDVQHGAGLVGANLIVRASVFREVGNFDPRLQRVKDTIGSMEDHDYLLRLDRAHKKIMYVPDIIVYAYSFPERLTKSYHRRWHYGHGHFYAVMREEKFESSRARLFDVPAHLYRRTLSNMLDWFRYRLTNNRDLQFEQELEIHFFCGFFRKRFADWRVHT